MSTFQEVNDSSLIKLIGNAQQRVVFVAPGVHQAVAEALGKRLAEIDRLQVTVVIDPDEDVCRIGYGDAQGLELLKLVFKDVTYEQTKNPEFRAKVEKALPAAKRKQMGDWNHDFDAAKAVDGQVNVSRS